MAKKLTIEEVRKYVEAQGCKLVSTEYKGSHEKLDFICQCGQPFSKLWLAFKRGETRCKDCSRKLISQKLSLSYEDVKFYVEFMGCKLVSEEFTGYTEKLDLICSCGKPFKSTFADFKLHGKCQCPSCREKEKAKHQQAVNMIGAIALRYRTLDPRRIALLLEDKFLGRCEFDYDMLYDYLADFGIRYYHDIEELLDSFLKQYFIKRRPFT